MSKYTLFMGACTHVKIIEWPMQVFPQGPRILSDPGGRFAAVLVYRHQLAMLPSIEVGEIY